MRRTLLYFWWTLPSKLAPINQQPQPRTITIVYEPCNGCVQCTQCTQYTRLSLQKKRKWIHVINWQINGFSHSFRFMLSHARKVFTARFLIDLFELSAWWVGEKFLWIYISTFVPFSTKLLTLYYPEFLHYFSFAGKASNQRVLDISTRLVASIKPCQCLYAMDLII